jgi:hypothetical protein
MSSGPSCSLASRDVDRRPLGAQFLLGHLAALVVMVGWTPFESAARGSNSPRWSFGVAGCSACALAVASIIDRWTERSAPMDEYDHLSDHT